VSRQHSAQSRVCWSFKYLRSVPTASLSSCVRIPHSASRPRSYLHWTLAEHLTACVELALESAYHSRSEGPRRRDLLASGPEASYCCMQSYACVTRHDITEEDPRIVGTLNALLQLANGVKVQLFPNWITGFSLSLR
jgi:hypothetical protein